MNYNYLCNVSDFLTTSFRSYKRIHLKAIKNSNKSQNKRSKQPLSLDLLEVDRDINFDEPNLKKKTNISFYKKNRELVYGIHPVHLALQANTRQIYYLYYKYGLDIKEKVSNIISMALENGVPTMAVNKKWLNEHFDEEVHQNICLEASLISPPLFATSKHGSAHIENFIKHHSQPSDGRELMIYLDSIHDPMNMGAVIRSSYLLGVKKILTGVSNCCQITSTVSKASAGAAEVFPIILVEDIARCIPELRKRGWCIISSVSQSLPNAIPITEFEPQSKNLLILGNEQNGVKQELQNLSDCLVTIPPERNTFDISFNISSAASILIHSILSKLR